MQHTDRYLAVRAQFAVSENAGQSQRRRDRANATLQRVLDSLRVFQRGYIYFGGIIHRQVNREGSVELFHRRWPENPIAFYPLLSRETLEEFREFWAQMQSRAVRERQHLNLGIRWFSGSEEAAGIDDRLISLMTAAEALFRAGDIEKKAEHLSREIAKLNLAPIRDEVVEAHISDSYRLRNEILHSGHSGGWRPKGSRRLTPDELLAFVHVTSEHVRGAIRSVIGRTASASQR
jgi:hypothetical protein